MHRSKKHRYSITSSASASSLGGISRPSALAVLRLIVRLAAVGSSLEFVAKRAGPFGPREMPLLGKLDRERKCLRLPRLGKYRPFLLARQARRGIKPLGLDRGIR